MTYQPLKEAPSKASAEQAVEFLRAYINPLQLGVISENFDEEEGGHFCSMVVDLQNLIKGMPVTRETEDQGDNAVVYLHYFKGACDFYITERDIDEDGEGQVQAFGFTDLGYGGEMGYISIPELLEAGVELDLYWDSKPLGAIKQKHSCGDESSMSM
jgi:hypothetical protein